MHPWTRFREKKGWSQQGLARSLGLSSRGRVGDIERGAERASAELAILMDRLSCGEVPVAVTRPDLHDVRVIQPAPHSEASA